jgi:hypothetical protein
MLLAHTFSPAHVGVVVTAGNDVVLVLEGTDCVDDASGGGGVGDGADVDDRVDVDEVGGAEVVV